MTREEKARAYDEALERAKHYQKVNGSAVISAIFPELKESEDERVRKEMIYWLKGFIGEEEGCGYTEGEIRERIAYLERQKEMHPSEQPVPKFKVGDFVMDTNYQGNPIYEILSIDKSHYICEYRGDKSLGDRTVMHFSIVNPYLRLVQKPTWKPSEEQMEALRRMKAAIAGEGEIYIPLNSLYDDLKKLM